MRKDINVLLFTGDKCDVFFVSAAKRKSQKTGELQRQNAVFAFCVHREACYCSRNCCFCRGVNSNNSGKIHDLWEITIDIRRWLL